MSNSTNSSDSSQPTVPVHLGIILDGNRRWARDQGLPTLEGHKKGRENLKDIAKAAFDRDIKYVTAFIFSTENWSRASEEVDYLMNLAMKIASKDVKELMDNNIRVAVLGIHDKVPKKVIETLQKVERDSAGNTGGTIALCFNYGGFQEIVDATKQLISNGTAAEDVTADLISQHLYYPDIPPIDLIIRTSGEQRISNFMLWRAAYAELYFTDKHWPAFTEADLDAALREFSNRNRRFGGN